MLTLRLDVNGQTINIVKIMNRGPKDYEYEDGDHPGGDGVRVYEWSALNGGGGFVEHARRDGAEVDYTGLKPAVQLRCLNRLAIFGRLVWLDAGSVSVVVLSDPPRPRRQHVAADRQVVAS